MLPHKPYFYLFFILIFNFVALNSYAQRENNTANEKENHWVDSVFNKLGKRQKIAQLFFVRAHTDKGKRYEDSVADVIQTQQLGGVVFFQGGPVRQAELINKYQKLVNVPLMIAMDGGWG